MAKQIVHAGDRNAAPLTRCAFGLLQVRTDLHCQRQHRERREFQHRRTPAAADKWVDIFVTAGTGGRGQPQPIEALIAWECCIRRTRSESTNNAAARGRPPEASTDAADTCEHSCGALRPR